jgi:hypothetical protein
VDVVTATNPNRVAREVDVAPLQCEELAHPQSGERSREEQCGVVLGRASADQSPNLLGRECLEII